MDTRMRVDSGVDATMAILKLSRMNVCLVVSAAFKHQSFAELLKEGIFGTIMRMTLFVFCLETERRSTHPDGYWMSQSL